MDRYFWLVVCFFDYRMYGLRNLRMFMNLVFDVSCLSFRFSFLFVNKLYRFLVINGGLKWF